MLNEKNKRTVLGGTLGEEISMKKETISTLTKTSDNGVNALFYKHYEYSNRVKSCRNVNRVVNFL